MTSTVVHLAAACATVALLTTCAPMQLRQAAEGWDAAEAQCAKWIDGRFYCTSAPERRFETPQPLNVPLALTRISGSTWAACGLDVSGGAYCWRWNQSFEGQREVLTLGIDSLSDRTGQRFTIVASNGGDWVCGIDQQAVAWCAAMLPRALQGCLEDDANVLCARQPTRVAPRVGFSQIEVGEAPHGSYGFACGLSRDAQVYCWHRDGVFLFTEGGNPELCRIPRLKLLNCTREPRPVHSAARFTSISVGMGYACGVTVDSQLLCWGYSGPLAATEAFQNCDHGSEFICTAVPSKVVGSSNVTAVDAGDLHVCVIREDRSAVCWGNGSMSQLGARSETSSSFGDGTLVRVEGGHRWREITAGPFLTCGITTNGEWYCWGQQPVDNPVFTGPQRIPDPRPISR